MDGVALRATISLLQLRFDWSRYGFDQALIFTQSNRFTIGDKREATEAMDRSKVISSLAVPCSIMAVTLSAPF